MIPHIDITRLDDGAFFSTGWDNRSFFVAALKDQYGFVQSEDEIAHSYAIWSDEIDPAGYRSIGTINGKWLSVSPNSHTADTLITWSPAP